MSLARHIAIVCVAWLLALSTAQAGSTRTARGWRPQPDWDRLFTEADATGTLAVLDTRDGRRLAHDPARARKRFVPASTFKIPHLLFALDAGVAGDDDQVFRWDGVQRRFAHWNRDQTLRSAMQGSTVWVFQGFARALGEDRERGYLHRTGYGNARVGSDVERFWLDGPLAISAVEQIAFLQRLHDDALPFPIDHQHRVKALIRLDSGPHHTLYGKTGWTFDAAAQLGWFVGWVDTPDGPVFFAANLDMPHGAADAPLRESLVRSALRGIGALPAQ